jgi:alpha-1,2-mannosyltransferase
MGSFDDFTPYWNGARSVAAGHSPYEWLAENRAQEVPDYIYPPLLAIVLAPFTRILDYPAARWAWLGVSTLCIAVSLPLIWRVSGLRWDRGGLLVFLVFIPILPALTMTLRIGQISAVQLLLTVGTLIALSARQRVAGGALIAVSAYIKSFPALLGGYLLLRREWRAALATVVAGIVLTLLSWSILGWEPLVEYFTGVVPAQRHWFGAPFNMSITGFFTHLLVDNLFTTPVVTASTAGPVAIMVGTVALLAVSGYAIWQASPTPDMETATYALAVMTFLLASPVNGNQNLVIVLLPLAVAAGHVQRVWPHHLRWLLVSALLISLPWEFCDFWLVQDYCLGSIAAMPTNALLWRNGWGNLLISGPFFGLVSLWLLLLRICLGCDRTAAAS